MTDLHAVPGQFRYIDTHCHLAHDMFASDASEVIARSLAAGVGMLTVGGDLASSRRSVELAQAHPGVWAAVGVHPSDVAGLGEDAWREVAGLARAPGVAAIGETGLDYYWLQKDPALRSGEALRQRVEEQKHWFRRHIELALEVDKPLSVHARDSVGDMLATVGPYCAEGLQVIWHCFVAGKKEIDAALDTAVGHGIYLALGGLVTFEDQKPLRNRVGRIPDRLLLLETDAPYLTPRPRVSEERRNLPTGVIRVAEVLAELRGTTAEEIAGITTVNAEKLLLR